MGIIDRVRGIDLQMRGTDKSLRLPIDDDRRRSYPFFPQPGLQRDENTPLRSPHTGLGEKKVIQKTLNINHLFDTYLYLHIIRYYLS